MRSRIILPILLIVASCSHFKDSKTTEVVTKEIERLPSSSESQDVVCSINTGLSSRGGASGYRSKMFKGGGYDRSEAITNARSACHDDKLFEYSTAACDGAEVVDCTEPRRVKTCSINTGLSSRGGNSGYKSKIFKGEGLDKREAVTNAQERCLLDSTFKYSSFACTNAEVVDCSEGRASDPRQSQNNSEDFVCSINTGVGSDGRGTGYRSKIFKGSGLERREAITNARSMCHDDKLFEYSTAACDKAAVVDCTEPQRMKVCSINTGLSSRGGNSGYRSKIFKGQGRDDKEAVTNAQALCTEDTLFEYSTHACTNAGVVSCSVVR